MAEIDIKKGDYLVVGTDQYVIREVEWWELKNANTPAFVKLATVSCSTKRLSFSNNKRQTVENASTHLTDLKCTSFDVISANVALRLDLKTLYTLRQTQISNATGYKILVLEVND